MSVSDRTGIDSFVKRTAFTAVLGAFSGAVLGIGAAPGALFLASVSVVGEGLNWLGRKVLHIRQDFAPLTLSIISTAISFFAAAKLVSLAGYTIPTGSALLVGGTPLVVSGLVLGFGAIALIILIAAIFQATLPKPSSAQAQATLA